MLAWVAPDELVDPAWIGQCQNFPLPKHSSQPGWEHVWGSYPWEALAMWKPWKPEKPQPGWE